MEGLVSAPWDLVANLPYHVTSPVLHQMLDDEPRPERFTLMVQREVAERVASPPGGMSYLSVFVQYHADVRIVCIVPPSSFEPAPSVDSAVLTGRTRATSSPAGVRGRPVAAGPGRLPGAPQDAPQRARAPAADGRPGPDRGRPDDDRHRPRSPSPDALGGRLAGPVRGARAHRPSRAGHEPPTVALEARRERQGQPRPRGHRSTRRRVPRAALGVPATGTRRHAAADDRDGRRDAARSSWSSMATRTAPWRTTWCSGPSAASAPPRPLAGTVVPPVRVALTQAHPHGGRAGRRQRDAAAMLRLLAGTSPGCRVGDRRWMPWPPSSGPTCRSASTGPELPRERRRRGHRATAATRRAGRSAAAVATDGLLDRQPSSRRGTAGATRSRRRRPPSRRSMRSLTCFGQGSTGRHWPRTPLRSAMRTTCGCRWRRTHARAGSRCGRAWSAGLAARCC